MCQSPLTCSLFLLPPPLEWKRAPAASASKAADEMSQGLWQNKNVVSCYYTFKFWMVIDGYWTEDTIFTFFSHMQDRCRPFLYKWEQLGLYCCWFFLSNSHIKECIRLPLYRLSITSFFKVPCVVNWARVKWNLWGKATLMIKMERRAVKFGNLQRYCFRVIT